MHLYILYNALVQWLEHRRGVCRKKQTFNIAEIFFRVGWALSNINNTFLFCADIFLLKFPIHSLNSSVVIYAFLLNFHVTGNLSRQRCLKQRGLAARPMTSGRSNSPVMLTHRASVILSLTFLPLVHS